MKPATFPWSTYATSDLLITTNLSGLVQDAVLLSNVTVNTAPRANFIDVVVSTTLAAPIILVIRGFDSLGKIIEESLYVSAAVATYTTVNAFSYIISIKLSYLPNNTSGAFKIAPNMNGVAGVLVCQATTAKNSATVTNYNKVGTTLTITLQSTTDNVTWANTGNSWSANGTSTDIANVTNVAALRFKVTTTNSGDTFTGVIMDQGV